LEEDWRALRARLEPRRRSRWMGRPAFMWVPGLAVAAAVAAFVLFPGRTVPVGGVGEAAAVEFLEVAGSAEAPVVFVDEPSGWLVVWAVQPG
jgi:hypothetical protein